MMQARSLILAALLSGTAAAATAPGAALTAERNGPPPKNGAGVFVNKSAFVPDLARGKEALAAGRLKDAEQDLTPLAKRGYTDAQVALARTYALMEDSPEALGKAVKWYRIALRKVPTVDVPLARLLLRLPGLNSAAEAEHLLRGAYELRDDPDAMAALMRLYTASSKPEDAPRLAVLVARAKTLDRPELNAALIHWYRDTPRLEDHAQALVTLCRRSLDLVPECYVDLVRAARAEGDTTAMEQLTAAALSQYGRGSIPAPLLASLAQSLVADPNDDIPEPIGVQLSDLPEEEDAVLGRTGLASADPASQARTCPDDPILTAPPAAPASLVTDPAAPGGSATVTQATGTAARPGSAPAGVATTPAAAPSPASGAAPDAALTPPSDSANANANANPELANAVIARLEEGDAESRVLAAGVVVRYPYLAPNLEIEPVLQAGADATVPEAPLYLGQMYLYGQRTTRDPARAREELELAASKPVTQVLGHYWLGRLYQYGYLDEIDADQARQHLLVAARNGYGPADTALARLFASGKGVCTNRSYAWVFAKLGAQSGAPAVRLLLDKTEAVLTPDQQQAAEAMLKQELQLRAANLNNPIEHTPIPDLVITGKSS